MKRTGDKPGLTIKSRVRQLEKQVDILNAESDALKILFIIALADAVKNDANPQARYDLIRAESRRLLAGKISPVDGQNLELAVMFHESLPESMEELLSSWDYIQSILPERKSGNEA